MTKNRNKSNITVNKKSDSLKKTVRFFMSRANPNIKINCKKLLRIPIDKISSSKYIIDCVKASLLIKQSQWKHEKEVRF